MAYFYVFYKNCNLLLFVLHVPADAFVCFRSQALILSKANQFITLKTPRWRGFYACSLKAYKCFKEKSCKVLCSSDLKDLCAANRTFAFHCWLSIFHGNFLCIRNIPFLSTLYTIHCCHFLITSFQTMRINANFALLLRNRSDIFSKVTISFEDKVPHAN